MFFSACSINSSITTNLLSYIESKNSMSEVIQRSERDFDVAFEIICEWFDAEDESDRVVATITFTVIVTLCWIIFDIISRIIAWIIFCIFWSIRSRYWFVIFASLKNEKIIEWDDFLWSLKFSRWRFFSFCSMIFEISSRVFSDSELFSNDSVKSLTKKLDNSAEFVKQSTDDYAKFFEELIKSSVIFLIWANNSFSLFFFKKSFVNFFEKFLSNFNETRISSLEDFLFLNDVSDVVNLIDWNVRDVWMRFSFVDENLNCSYFFLRFSSHFAKPVVSLSRFWWLCWRTSDSKLSRSKRSLSHWYIWKIVLCLVKADDLSKVAW
jgi:hypothetical protein